MDPTARHGTRHFTCLSVATYLQRVSLSTEVRHVLCIGIHRILFKQAAHCLHPDGTSSETRMQRRGMQRYRTHSMFYSVQGHSQAGDSLASSTPKYVVITKYKVHLHRICSLGGKLEPASQQKPKHLISSIDSRGALMTTYLIVTERSIANDIVLTEVCLCQTHIHFPKLSTIHVGIGNRHCNSDQTLKMVGSCGR